MTKKGFTLVEIMVVIGIIVILTGIVIMGADSARKMARDNQRVADIQLIQLKLEAYKAEKGVYPPNLTPMRYTYINPSSLKDPQGNDYKYAGVRISTSRSCVSYHLGVKLETNNSVLQKAKHKAAAGSGNYCNDGTYSSDPPPFDNPYDFDASDAGNPAPNLWYDVVSPNDFN